MKYIKNNLFFIFPIIILIFVILIVTISKTFQFSKYDKNWIVGKTQDEIEERYGELKIVIYHTSDGPKQGYGYMLKPERPGFMEKVCAVYYIIDFENEIAVGTLTTKESCHF